MDLGNLDLSSVSEFGGPSLLPPGQYLVSIVNCEAKKWPSGDDFLSLTYRVEDGPCAGRSCFDTLSLWDSNPKFRNMALSRLKSIRKALGFNPNVSGSTEELLDKMMIIKVAIRAKDGREYQNVSNYKPANHSSGAPVPPQAAPQPQPAASSARPW